MIAGDTLGSIAMPVPESLGRNGLTQLNEARLTTKSDETEPSQPVPNPVCELKHEVYVRIPDLFSSIMAQEPVENPNRSEVEAESDEWIREIMKMDEKAAAKHMRAQFCYISSLWTPTSDKEGLRLMTDWVNWVFLFDDQFDEGFLKDDPVATQEEVDATMAIMSDDAPLYGPEVNPIRYVFQVCWQRIKSRASLGKLPDKVVAVVGLTVIKPGIELQQRCRDQHKFYFDQIVVQVQRVAAGEDLASDLQTYMKMRRGTIGAYPAIAVSECVHSIELPEHVFLHPSLQECVRISSDLILLVNDLLSYRKDVELGTDFGVIPILQGKGLSIQQSIDQIGAMMNDRYRGWYTSLAELPSYGRKIDREVLKFVEVCRLVALGNLYWSFKTGRYLGAEGPYVYETKIMRLPSRKTTDSGTVGQSAVGLTCN
ncbi:hypothetical protein O1611_g72 [Lasiodiplodia mahajangana]|uniref:Uncharacterized protein n=1 Tax=Lasiodiplodia mahajangana TaxID=1108764 RepID=A0ACC2K1D6_9PEZI|nr:hypothetical protein O1611_g72 [Lasiodiplodia mahajangana]